MLETKLPALHDLFSESSFIVSKTKQKFSAIAYDHAHEQCNALVKGDGGAIGITSNYNVLDDCLRSTNSWVILKEAFHRNMDFMSIISLFQVFISVQGWSKGHGSGHYACWCLRNGKQYWISWNYSGHWLFRQTFETRERQIRQFIRTNRLPIF